MYTTLLKCRLPVICLFAYYLFQVLHVCFHPTEYLLATGSADRLVRFWDIETAECVSQSGPADGTLREIVFQSDGTALLTLTDWFV